MSTQYLRASARARARIALTPRLSSLFSFSRDALDRVLDELKPGRRHTHEALEKRFDHLAVETIIRIDGRVLLFHLGPNVGAYAGTWCLSGTYAKQCTDDPIHVATAALEKDCGVAWSVSDVREFARVRTHSADDAPVQHVLCVLDADRALLARLRLPPVAVEARLFGSNELPTLSYPWVGDPIRKALAVERS